MRAAQRSSSFLPGFPGYFIAEKRGGWRDGRESDKGNNDRDWRGWKGISQAVSGSDHFRGSGVDIY